jgi:hypothetical protein
MNANELKRWRKMKDAKGLRSDKELLLLLMEGGS